MFSPNVPVFPFNYVWQLLDVWRKHFWYNCFRLLPAFVDTEVVVFIRKSSTSCHVWLRWLSQHLNSQNILVWSTHRWDLMNPTRPANPDKCNLQRQSGGPRNQAVSTAASNYSKMLLEVLACVLHGEKEFMLIMKVLLGLKVWKWLSEVTWVDERFFLSCFSVFIYFFYHRLTNRNQTAQRNVWITDWAKTAEACWFGNYIFECVCFWDTRRCCDVSAHE